MTDAAIATLNRLIETCRDAERGFHAATNAVSDPALKRLFSAYAQQRDELARELEGEVTRLGGAPQRGGSVAGALHRALINVRAAVSGKEEDAVIAEAERGEEIALRTYADALASRALPEDVGAVVARQAAQIRDAHARVSDLKRAA